jgi:hypothetical protein
MFDWIKSKLQPRNKELHMTPQPIEVNPSAGKQLLRRVGRLSRLMQCQAKGDTRPDLLEEIRVNKLAIDMAGYPVPQTHEEATALYKQLGGE